MLFRCVKIGVSVYVVHFFIGALATMFHSVRVHHTKMRCEIAAASKLRLEKTNTSPIVAVDLFSHF